MAGWIKLHRDMTSHWLWDGEPFSRAHAWVDLLLWARHSPGKTMIDGKPVTLKEGQQARSEVTLSKSWGWSRGKVRRFLNALIDDGMIVQQTSNRTSVITICNYSKYQDGSATVEGDGSTPNEHQSVQQSDISRYTIEEGEEGKKGKKDTCEESGDSSPLSCPHGEILDAWAEVMPDKQQPRKNMWKPSRKEYKHLAARWREMMNTPHSQTGQPLYTTRDEGIRWWKAFFTNVRKSQFLMDDQPWFTFGWIVAKSNFYKIIEGNYHQ